MLAKKITYTNFNGEECTETFYFNISRAEVLEMEMLKPGGYSEYLQEIVDSKDRSRIMEIFKTFILNSYGKKSEDGKRFMKSPEISKEFEQCAAYDELFLELLQSTDAQVAFINGILPIDTLNDSQKTELNAKTKALIESKKQD